MKKIILLILVVFATFQGSNAQNGTPEENIDYWTTQINNNTNYTIAYNNRGIIYFNIKDYELAIEDFTKSIELNPYYASAYKNRATVYYNLGKYELAIEDFTKAIELKPVTDIYYINRGDAYCALTKYELAIEDYTKAIEINPTCGACYNYRGIAYYNLKEHKLAIGDFTKAIELKPTSDVYFNNRGNTYSTLKEYELAIEDFTKAIELKPTADIYYNNRGNAYSVLKEYELARVDYTKAIELKPKSEVYYYNNGIAYSALTKYELAIVNYTKAIALKPTAEDYYNFRGIAYSALKEYELAIQDYAKAIELKPDYVPPYCNRGDIYVNKKKYELAKADYNKAIALDPNFATAYNNRGLLYFKLGNYSLAIDNLEKAITLAPKDDWILYNLINIQCCNNDYLEAKANFEKATQLTKVPTFLNNKSRGFLIYYITACISYLSKNDYENALAYLLKSLTTYKEIDDKYKEETAIHYANVLAKTGYVYEQLNNYDKAMEFYKSAQIISPQVQNVSDKIAQLQLKIDKLIVKDMDAPTIEILTPKVTRSQTVEADDAEGASIFVSGIAKDISTIAWVKINGVDVSGIKNNGYFSASISSTANKIVVQAADDKNNISTTSFTIEKVKSKSDNPDEIPPITIENAPTFHALLIACSDYTGSWQKLPTTISESKEIKQVLIMKYGFMDDNIIEIYNQNYASILSTLSSKLKSMKQNDNLVIYFGGHGTYKETGNQLIGYWVPLNATDKDVDYISNLKLNELIAGSEVKHILILSDACYSGAMRSNVEVKPPTKWEYQLRSREILTSGGLEKVPGQSVFIPMILKALESNTDKYLSSSKLYSIIFNGVNTQAETEPVLVPFGKDGNEGGKFYFIKN